ncbi:MAG: hypothetical protein ACWGO1_09285, partial [Anaerolineales bacterium]
MTNPPFIVELKHLLPETDWSWVAAGLHHDSLVWGELRGDLGDRVLQSLGSKSEAYLPGVVSLIELGHPDPLEILPLIQSRGTSQVYPLLSANTTSEQPPTRLGEAGIQALEMLELWNVASSWQGLEHKLSSLHLTAAACLYSLLEDRSGLLIALIAAG